MEKLSDPFRVLFEANPLPMWIFDAQSLRFLAVNDGAIRLYGYSREEFLGMTLRDIRPAEDVACLEMTLANLSDQPVLVDAGEWRHCRKDREMIYVQVSSQAVTYNARPARLSMLMDVTSRKQNEGALRRSETRLNEAQHVAGLGSWEWNIPEATSSYSDELFRLFGLPPQGVQIDIDRLIAATYPEDREKFRTLLEEVAQKPRDFEINFRVQLAGCGVRQLHALGEVSYDASGNPVKMTGTAQDITDRMQAEEERLRSAQLQAANKELEAFSYSVSHDLRTPLRSIDAFSRLLEEEYGPVLNENGRGYIQLIRASTERMNQLIEDLIEFSRVTRTIMERVEVDLSVIVQGIARELDRANPGRKVQWRITPELKARVDPRLIRIVLENLLGNAWKFTGKTGAAQIEFGAIQKGDDPVFFVRDNGAGFDMEFVSRLFGVFQRLHSERDFTGTGIGLAIVQRIIARHGGSIWAQGAVNHGATFYFTLPG